jgi:hypothetical protein
MSRGVLAEFVTQKPLNSLRKNSFYKRTTSLSG